jgi:hypothetical protein
LRVAAVILLVMVIVAAIPDDLPSSRLTVPFSRVW